MAERGTKATLLWDLDHTIGDFRGMRTISPEFAEPIRLRYGIHDLLNEFSGENGYRHIVTSSAGPGYINEALNRTYLRGKFSAMFGDDVIRSTEQGKHYRPAVRGTSPEEMRAHMIAIGDSNKDKPVDIGGMLFLELGLSEPPLEALVIREIITTVLEAGNGQFKEGFEALYKKATVDAQERRRLDIGNDISFVLEYRTAEEVAETELREVPVICSIRSDSHRKPYQPFF